MAGTRELISVGVDIGTTTTQLIFSQLTVTDVTRAGQMPRGTPIAYLIAPPLEGTYALDAALKAAEVRIVCYTAPPSETNYIGAILTGEQPDCKAAVEAFKEAVLSVARSPLED